MEFDPRLSPNPSTYQGPPHRRCQAGFALPWVMFTLVLLGLLATSGFLLTWLEGRSARAFSRSTDAFFVAEAGLATALASVGGPSPQGLQVGIGSGSAAVTFEQLLDLAPGEKIFRIESTGTVAAGGATYRRSVAQLAWVPSPPRTPGALVAVGAVGGVGPTGTISGYDVGPGGCPAQSSPVAGIAIWSAPSPPPWGGLSITGSPTVRPIAGTSVALETGIRWPELLAPYGPVPDATVPPDPWPGAMVGGAWPYIRIPGSSTLATAQSGTGVLVVEGDATLSAGFSWTGLLLVGGSVRLSGDARIRGAVFAGLAGQSALAVDLASHRLDLEMDTCAVARAAVRITAPAAVVPGTWSEVW